MKIFISWSGNLSLRIAEALSKWIPSVIQNAKPFMSSEDIRKGERWSLVIAHQLKESNFGIICLTKDNLVAPWILFEAGALSKEMVDTNVCGVLFEGLKKPNTIGPLSMFQLTEFEKNDIKKLINTINEKLGDYKFSSKCYR